MFSNLLNRLPTWIKNKYSITVLVFLLWLTFFDKNDLITRYSYHRQLSKLNQDKEYYLAEIEKNKRELFELMSDPAHLEKFAREKYLMKKDNEEIFVIVPEHQKESTSYVE